MLPRLIAVLQTAAFVFRHMTELAAPLGFEKDIRRQRATFYRTELRGGRKAGRVLPAGWFNGRSRL